MRGIPRLFGSMLATFPLCWSAATAQADEGGVGFWLSGQMGSFSAVPSDPGWTIPAFYTPPR